MQKLQAESLLKREQQLRIRAINVMANTQLLEESTAKYAALTETISNANTGTYLFRILSLSDLNACILQSETLPFKISARLCWSAKSFRPLLLWPSRKVRRRPAAAWCPDRLVDPRPVAPSSLARGPVLFLSRSMKLKSHWYLIFINL